MELSNGKITKMDRDTWFWARRYQWYSAGAGFAYTSLNGRTYYLHRMILGLKHGDKRYGDHINFDILDNRKSNLRIVTSKQSAKHRRKPNRRVRASRVQCKYKGVSWSKQKRCWQVRCNGQFGGLFVNLQTAAKKYNTMAQRMDGEFAVLNCI